MIRKNSRLSFQPGDKVRVVGSPHMEGQGDGTIVQALLTDTYSVDFAGTEHKWYVGDELEPLDGDVSAGGGMKMNSLRMTERRASAGLQFREATPDAKDGSIGTLSGYAAVFGAWSEDLGGFREKIRVGAFKKSLDAGEDVRALMAHDTATVIGRRSAKTLEISEDEKGLRFEVKLPNTSAARDLVESVKRGDITGMSFGFETIEDSWTHRKEGESFVYERELIEVRVIEISPVAFPAYTATSAEVRSVNEKIVLDGRRRLGMEAHRRRDSIIAQHRARMALWTGR